VAFVEHFSAQPLARPAAMIWALGLWCASLVLVAIGGIWRLVVWLHARQTRDWDHAGPIDEDDSADPR
jgi:hypothetical protein